MNLFNQRILQSLGFLLVMFQSFQTLQAQSSVPSDSLKQVLLAKEKEMFSVMVEGDKPAATKMVGEDYITINADGVIQNKEETMKTLGRFKGSTGKLSDADRTIRVYGNIAIITGRAKAYMKGILVADFLYTQTWTRRKGQWEFIGWQGTMTGLPAWYPVIITAVLLILLYLITRFVRKKIRRSRRTTEARAKKSLLAELE